ncbi:MAG TPA: MSMEG_3727 family PQQ-associated protein [Sphingomicrobium sp.]|nr:MSMEG_3727 family PQQ-associated protein [Sphingomicrobium sp.]
MRRRTVMRTAGALVAMLSLASCEYLGLVRPSVLGQVDPEMATLINELPNLDEMNEAMIGRLYATGGASRANLGRDGVWRDRIRVPRDEYLWYPAIIIMQRGGTLELDITNEDHRTHAMLAPSNGERQNLMLPASTRGIVRVTLDQPGLYWFGCPVANHAGRGMLGFVLVKGEVPPEARLDRPRQPQPGNRRPPRAHQH